MSADHVPPGKLWKPYCRCDVCRIARESAPRVVRAAIPLSDYNRRYYEEHRDEILERNRVRGSDPAVRSAKAEYNRRYNEANPNRDAVLARKRAASRRRSESLTPEQLERKRESARRYREAHREQLREKNRQSYDPARHLAKRDEQGDES